MDAQSFCDARSELLGLYKDADQVANAVYAGTLGELAPGVGARAAGALLENDDAQLIADGRMRVLQLLGGARGGLIHAEASFDADDEQIEDVGQAQADLVLPGLDSPAQPKVRRKKTESQCHYVGDEIV